MIRWWLGEVRYVQVGRRGGNVRRERSDRRMATMPVRLRWRRRKASAVAGKSSCMVAWWWNSWRTVRSREEVDRRKVAGIILFELWQLLDRGRVAGISYFSFLMVANIFERFCERVRKVDYSDVSK